MGRQHRRKQNEGRLHAPIDAARLAEALLGRSCGRTRRPRSSQVHPSTRIRRRCARPQCHPGRATRAAYGFGAWRRTCPTGSCRCCETVVFVLRMRILRIRGPIAPTHTVLGCGLELPFARRWQPIRKKLSSRALECVRVGQDDGGEDAEDIDG